MSTNINRGTTTSPTHRDLTPYQWGVMERQPYTRHTTPMLPDPSGGGMCDPYKMRQYKGKAALKVARACKCQNMLSADSDGIVYLNLKCTW